MTQDRYSPPTNQQATKYAAPIASPIHGPRAGGAKTMQQVAAQIRMSACPMTL
jgi:hypothetical protein